MLYSLQSEIKHFLKNIWENNVAIELVHAMDYLDMKDQGDGRFSFDKKKKKKKIIKISCL
jgi:hypothetical protein